MTNSEEKLVFAALVSVARAFRGYRKEVGAEEWARYAQGKTERYVACFTPLITALVQSGSENPLLRGQALVDWAMIQVSTFAEVALPRLNLPSDLSPIVPTYPWMPRTLLENNEFRAEIRIAIMRSAAQISGTLTRTLAENDEFRVGLHLAIEPSLARMSGISPNEEDRDTLPQQGAPIARRHGFQPNMARHRAIAAVVSRHAPQWAVASCNWRHLDQLKAICSDLDQGLYGAQRDLYMIPESWRMGRPKILRGQRVNSWTEALAACRKLLADQIAASLNALRPKEARQADNAQRKCPTEEA
jgi:hypothetical protein